MREHGSGPPVVVVHGGWGAEHSYLLDAIWPDPAETWRGVAPGDSLLRIEVLERAGHALWIDQPEAFRDTACSVRA